MRKSKLKSSKTVNKKSLNQQKEKVDYVQKIKDEIYIFSKKIPLLITLGLGGYIGYNSFHNNPNYSESLILSITDKVTDVLGYSLNYEKLVETNLDNILTELDFYIGNNNDLKNNSNNDLINILSSFKSGLKNEDLNKINISELSQDFFRAYLNIKIDYEVNRMYNNSFIDKYYLYSKINYDKEYNILSTNQEYKILEFSKLNDVKLKVTRRTNSLSNPTYSYYNTKFSYEELSKKLVPNNDMKEVKDFIFNKFPNGENEKNIDKYIYETNENLKVDFINIFITKVNNSQNDAEKLTLFFELMNEINKKFVYNDENYDSRLYGDAYIGIGELDYLSIIHYFFEKTKISHNGVNLSNGNISIEFILDDKKYILPTFFELKKYTFDNKSSKIDNLLNQSDKQKIISHNKIEDLLLSEVFLKKVFNSKNTLEYYDFTSQYSNFLILSQHYNSDSYNYMKKLIEYLIYTKRYDKAFDNIEILKKKYSDNPDLDIFIKKSLKKIN